MGGEKNTQKSKEQGEELFSPFFCPPVQSFPRIPISAPAWVSKDDDFARTCHFSVHFVAVVERL